MMGTWKQRRTFLNNHSGFTLIEALVVVSLIAIALTMTTVTVSLAFSKDAEKAAKLIDNQLSNLRMLSQTKEGTWFGILEDSSADKTFTIYKKVGVNPAEVYEKIPLPTRVTYSTGDVSYEKNYLKFTFERSKGAIKDIVALDDLGMMETATQVAPNLFQIITTNEDASKKATITLVKVTGKHFVDYE